ncbi:MAG: hypothetical protein JXR76_13885 [Deltaproteobacteria bacterium]|nr:hypothetical protein [Deltaproteobacteria bacterium]
MLTIKKRILGYRNIIWLMFALTTCVAGLNGCDAETISPEGQSDSKECVDHLDNDLDYAVDCSDTDCAGTAICQGDTSAVLISAQQLNAGTISAGADGVLQIWTVGDSLTRGVDNGYRNQIWTTLKGNGYLVDFVGSAVHSTADTEVCPDADHDGHPQKKIGFIDEHITDWYSSIAEPDVILLMAGTNDLAWIVPNRTASLAAARRMLQLVEKTLALNSRSILIVSTIPPISDAKISEPEIERGILFVEYNEMLKRLVSMHAEFGNRLWLADVFSSVTVNDLTDGVHPSRTAYDKVGNAWLEVMLPLL